MGVGNVGAAVGALGRDFDISLATIGLLSGTLLLGFSLVGTVLTPLMAERFTIVRTLILGAALCTIGNLIFAVSPSLVGLVIGRAVAGFGVGIAVVAGPVFARATGGVERVGLFGAAVQLGIVAATTSTKSHSGWRGRARAPAADPGSHCAIARARARSTHRVDLLTGSR